MFGERDEGVAEVVEGFAEGSAPALVPAGFAAVAAAVGAPAFDAVGAGPGAVIDDDGLGLGREVGEEFGVVGELGVGVLAEGAEGGAEGHFAVFVVVAVAFAVGGDVRDLGAGAVVVESAEEAPGEVFAVVEQAFKGDGARVWAVVEEDGDGSSAIERDGVGVGGIDGAVRGLGPGVGMCV